MPNYTHAFFIDESGNGGANKDLNWFVVSTAVSVALDEKDNLDSLVANIIGTYLRPGCKEIHGSEIPHRLRSGISIRDFGIEIAKAIKSVNADIWITCTHHGINPLPGIPSNSTAKDIVRQLLFERLSGFLDAGYCDPGRFFIIWDLSEPQELNDFSAAVVKFRNPVSGKTVNPRLVPAVLGGLSHDWAGLQIADIVSNYCLHFVASAERIPNCHPEKSKTFYDVFHPLLKTDSMGNKIGFKEW